MQTPCKLDKTKAVTRNSRDDEIGKNPVRIILWWPTTKMLIKSCFLIQPLEQEGGGQKCCISLCSLVLINHFYQMKAGPECLKILIYWSKYSRIPLSRAPLTRENQLVALTPWTPNFSDATLATAHMTDPVTHMCWCEQITPLAHSSQATWQPFNLSHCIEMHNTHLLGLAGQLSQAYVTHSAPILTPRNLPPTVNKQWPP